MRSTFVLFKKEHLDNYRMDFVPCRSCSPRDQLWTLRWPCYQIKVWTLPIPNAWKINYIPIICSERQLTINMVSLWAENVLQSRKKSGKSPRKAEKFLAFFGSENNSSDYDDYAERANPLTVESLQRQISSKLQRESCQPTQRLPWFPDDGNEYGWGV